MESKPNRAKPGFWPALALFFLAPAIGELLSGSAPPAEFFNPFSILILGALYGSGALLVRELRVRWNKGWATVFALGAAYGIIEEGLMVKSFFDPNWMDLGLLGTYGRWMGVNWVWTLELTLYHAVFSIAIPILLIELFFPAQRQQPWLGRRSMIFISMLLLIDVAFGYLALTTYRPPLPHYLLAMLVTYLLYRWARRLPAPTWQVNQDSETKPVPATRNFALLGFAATLAFFVCNWVLPNLGLPVPLTLAAVILLVVGLVGLLGSMSRRVGWSDAHRLALAGGALSFFILLAPLQELDQTRPDNTIGMALVGLAFALLLAWLWRRVRTFAHRPLESTPA
ncbi:MAG: hypothetical protein AB1894_20930 [Chloroflexota bacterium]